MTNTHPSTQTHREVAEHDAAMHWLEHLDPDTTPADDTDDLARIGDAALTLTHNEQALEDAIHTAREHGRSWTQIAQRLGVSRQAARQRWTTRIGV